MNIINIIILAFILSLDAFSVALSISTISNNNIKIYPIINGIFHFLFPLIGYLFGNFIRSNFTFNENHLITIIYLLIIIEIIMNLIKEDTFKINNILNIVLICISVSIDSFSIGLILNYSIINVLIICVTFSIFAFIISKLGLLIGSKLKTKLGFQSNYIGLILMIIVLIRHILL